MLSALVGTEAIAVLSRDKSQELGAGREAKMTEGQDTISADRVTQADPKDDISEYNYQSLSHFNTMEFDRETRHLPAAINPTRSHQRGLSRRRFIQTRPLFLLYHYVCRRLS